MSKNIKLGLMAVVLGFLVVVFVGCDMGTYEARFQEKLQKQGPMYSDSPAANEGTAEGDGS